MEQTQNVFQMICSPLRCEQTLFESYQQDQELNKRKFSHIQQGAILSIEETKDVRCYLLTVCSKLFVRCVQRVLHVFMQKLDEENFAFLQFLCVRALLSCLRLCDMSL